MSALEAGPVDAHMTVDDGLGNASYLVDLGDGRALAVDPARDPRPYLDRAERLGLTVAFAADTLVHADFVSGGRELSGLGARLLAPAAAGLSYGHHGLADGEAGADEDTFVARLIEQLGPHAVHHELGTLPDAAGQLAAADARHPSVLRGGPQEWAAARRRKLEYGT